MRQRESRDPSSFTEEERERQDSDRRNALLLLGQNRKLNHLPAGQGFGEEQAG